MVKARRNEAVTAKITDTPIMEMNSPAEPGISAIGAKANTVVAVDAKRGAKSVRTALSTAASRSRPRRRSRR